jgi:hypothetical protein
MSISGLYSHFSSGRDLAFYIYVYNDKTGEQVKYIEYEGWTLYSDSYSTNITRLQPSTTYRVEATIEQYGTIILGRAASVTVSGKFTTSALSTDISFSNATENSVDALISGLSTDFGAYSDIGYVHLTLFVYKNGSVYDTLSAVDITGNSSYKRTLTGLSEGVTYTLRAVIKITSKVILASLYDVDVLPSDEDGVYILEKDFVLGSGGSVTYEPELSSVAITKRSSLTTSSQIGVRVTGLDSNYPGTYTITLSAYANGTYYSPTSSVVTVPSGSNRSDDIVFTGLPSSTSIYVFGNVLYEYGDTSGSVQLDGIYISTAEPDDSYYPDFSEITIHWSPTATSITAYATGIDDNYSYGNWAINWILYENYPSGRVASKSDTLNAGLSQTGSVSFTGLDQNMTYDLVLRLSFRYAGSSHSEEIFEIVQTGTDANYVPNMDESDLLLSDASASTDYALKVRVNGLDPAFSGTWSIKYTVKKDGTTITTKTVSQSGNVSNSSYTQITGLQSGVNYQVYAEISVTVRGTKYTWYCDNEFVTSGSIEVEDTYGGALDAELVLTQGDNGTWIGAEIVGLDTSYTDPGRYVWWYLNGEFWDSDEIPKRASGISYEFEGLDLQSGGQYRVTAEIHYILSDDSDGIYTLEEWLQADEIIDFTSAVIVPDTRTSSSLVVYVAGLDTSYSRSDRSIEWYLNGTYKGRTTLRAYASTSTNYTFSSLTKSTLYTVMARIYYTSGGSSTYKDVTIQMFTLFEWDAQKVSGGDFNITASEWKKLLDYIKAVRQYKGFTAGSYTYPSKGDDFLASHYNQALNRITGISGSGYNANAVSSGDTIYASAINFLRDEINRLSEPDYE